LLLLAGCDRAVFRRDPVVARVNLKYLRASDIHTALGLYADSEEQWQFIESWINHEIWYRQAKKHVHSNAYIRRQVRDYRRELFIREYSQQEIRQNISVGENDVLSYYQDNPNEFIASKPGAFVEIYIGKNKEVLDDVLDHLRRAERAPLPPRLEYVSRGDFVEALDRRLFPEKNNPQYIGPLKIDNHYYLISVIERYSENSRLRVEHVRDQIIQKLEMQKYMDTYHQKQKDLKERFNVKIYKTSV